MIPAPFSYHRPKTLAEATALLAQHGEEARVLAGGQSLIPMMKLRLAAPEHLVDLAGIAELKGVQRTGNTLVIGAMTTQHELQGSKAVTDAAPIIREASLLVADPQVRYVGTLGGNVANGDPGNDMPAVMICLDASYRLAGRGGSAHGQGPRLLPGRLRHRPQARRDRHRHRGPHPAGWPRLCLREAQAQGRRLRHRGGGRGADRQGRQGRQLRHRALQPRRPGAARQGRGGRGGRHRARQARAGRRRQGRPGHHVAGLRHARAPPSTAPPSAA